MFEFQIVEGVAERMRLFQSVILVSTSNNSQQRGPILWAFLSSLESLLPLLGPSWASLALPSTPQYTQQRSGLKMMNDDDDFGPNPFRSSEPDLLGAPLHQQQPDPMSGMTGSFELPPASPPAQGSPHGQQLSPLSGPMEQQPLPRSYGGTDETGTPPPLLSWRSCVACFRLDSYFQYFNVDTVDIQQRVKTSVLQFWEPDVFRTACGLDDASAKGPDLYGPLWISMTLVFLIAVTSNLSAYWHHQQRHKADEVATFDADITLLLHAGYVVFGFVFGVSSVFWMLTTCMALPGIPWGLWVCCYGYSQVPILLATLVLWVPLALLEWCVLAVACVASCLLVVRNLSTPLLSQDAANQAKAAPLVLAMLACHFIYFLVLKIRFYE